MSAGVSAALRRKERNFAMRLFTPKWMKDPEATKKIKHEHQNKLFTAALEGESLAVRIEAARRLDKPYCKKIFFEMAVRSEDDLAVRIEALKASRFSRGELIRELDETKEADAAVLRAVAEDPTAFLSARRFLDLLCVKPALRRFLAPETIVALLCDRGPGSPSDRISEVIRFTDDEDVLKGILSAALAWRDTGGRSKPDRKIVDAVLPRISDEAWIDRLLKNTELGDLKSDELNMRRLRMLLLHPEYPDNFITHTIFFAGDHSLCLNFFKDERFSVPVRSYALYQSRFPDNIYYGIFKTEKERGFRETALRKISDQTILREILQRENDLSFRQIACGQLGHKFRRTGDETEHARFGKGYRVHTFYRCSVCGYTKTETEQYDS